jgi:TatD DNase family protein
VLNQQVVIDTHCHLDSPRFDADRAQVLARAWAAGVSGIVVPAVGPAGWDALLKLPETDARLKVALGVHPQLLPELPAADDEVHLQRLDGLLATGKAVAVGECGLDAGSIPGAPLERQVAVLRRHFALARKHRLPVLVHCLRAHPALLALLKEEPAPEAGLLLHSYSGGAEQVARYVKLGCHFSFAGAVTFEGARKPLAAVRAVPLDRVMAETDAPDQTPTPHRGERNEPAYLPSVVAALARAHGSSEGELARRTTENAARFFAGAFSL